MGFPKTLYHEIEGAVTVADQAAQAALGSAWHEGEHFFTAVVKMPHEAWTAAKSAVSAPIEAVENTLADAFEAVATEAETVAKRVRKPKKTAETPAN